MKAHAETNRTRAVVTAGALAVATMLSSLAMPPAAEAANSRGTWTADYCDTPKALCGGIVYGNSGAYVVESVELSAKGSQPDISSVINPKCKDYAGEKVKKNLALGDYVVFVVPADCAYRIQIKIQLGKSKDENVFLVPGCQLVTKTDGTTQSNEWHVNAEWADAAKKAGKSGDVVDMNGYKCGRLNKIGSGTS
jgi:hypothetical protein